MHSEILPPVPFCIYGAGIVGTSIYTSIKTLYHRKPLFFLVSDAVEGKCDENPTEIDGITVKRFSEWKIEMSSGNTILPDTYLVVAPEVHQPAIVASLRSLGIEESNIILFTNELENNFMEAYYSSLPGSNTVLAALSERCLQTSRKVDRIQVFQAKCHVDRALNHPKENPSYVYPIQVGAELTDKVILKLQDNTGDNISAKNRNYCELTAAYFAWKNSTADYKGLCHYRRIFDISSEQMQALLDKKLGWDVILPYPSIHYPNISTQHIRYIKDVDWEAMLIALKETAPDYFDAYNKLIMSGEKIFYNFNMLIAKATVFDDYCSFLFKILERTEELTTPKGWERSDRFAGYMGENLTTLYFLKNRDKLKILYSGKIWLT